MAKDKAAINDAMIHAVATIATVLGKPVNTQISRGKIVLVFELYQEHVYITVEGNERL